MSRLASLCRRLRLENRGATIVEFAIVAPVMVLGIMGLGELTYEIYVTSILQGELQKAGRDITLETAGASYSAIDEKVKTSVKAISKNATFTIVRKNFRDFASVKPERFTDANNNGKYDPNECFSDENGNNQWDAVGGRGGIGGAQDVVVYTVTVSYPPAFPVAAFFGETGNKNAKATTVLRSQPYGDQAAAVVPIAVCPT